MKLAALALVLSGCGLLSKTTITRDQHQEAARVAVAEVASVEVKSTTEAKGGTRRTVRTTRTVKHPDGVLDTTVIEELDGSWFVAAGGVVAKTEAKREVKADLDKSKDVRAETKPRWWLFGGIGLVVIGVILAAWKMLRKAVPL